MQLVHRFRAESGGKSDSQNLSAQPKSLSMAVGPSVTSPVADNICPANGVLNTDVIERNKAANPLFITMIQGGFLPFH